MPLKQHPQPGSARLSPGKQNIEHQEDVSPISSFCHQVNGGQDTDVLGIPAELLRELQTSTYWQLHWFKGPLMENLARQVGEIGR